MLSLQPKVDRAIRQTSGKPVLYAEIITGLLDKLIALYNDWTTVGAPDNNASALGYVLAQNRTQIQKEETQSANPFSALQMLYPAQGGDPIQDAYTFNLSAASGDSPTVRLNYGPPQSIVLSGIFGTDIVFQSFMLTSGEQSSYDVSKIRLKLKREISSNRAILALKVIESNKTVRALPVEGNILFNLYSAIEINSSTISTSFSDVTFSFSSPIPIKTGVEYIALLMLHTAGAASRDVDPIFWETYHNRDLKPSEFSGKLIYDGYTWSFGIIDKQELFLKIIIPAYSYDGSTANYRKMKHDLGQTPLVNGFFDFDYEAIKDARVRFRAWASSTGSFGGEETDIGSTDLHKLSIDGHDGSVAHVHDGDEISNLKRYYAIECNLLGMNSPPLWAATTAKSVGNVIRPTVSGGNGFVYECTIAGTTGGSEPTWPLTEGSTVTDGSVTWRAVSFSLLYTPSVRKLNIVFPRRIHKFSSAPVNIDGCLPFIKEIPSVPTKLDLKGYLAQTQSFRLNLADIQGYGSLSALEENLKNSTVELRIGMNAEEIDNKNDMAPYAGGKVVDYSYEMGIMSISIQDRSKDFSIKLPRQKGLKFISGPPPSLDYTGFHLVDALEDLMVNRIRIPRRFIDLTTFRTVRDTRLGDKWKSMRVIPGDKPEEGKSLIKEILEVIGCFLVAGEDGKLRLVQYPRSENSVITWDDNDLIPGTSQQDSFDSSIINQCVLKYNFAIGSDDYSSYGAYIDADSQSDWAPGAGVFVADRTIESKWVGSDNYFGGELASTITAREVRHKKDGIINTKVQTSLRHLAIQVGDYVDLKTPIFLRKGYRGSLKSAQKFMVASKTIQYGRGMIDWELIEARDFNRAPIPAFSMDVTAGTPSFTVNVNGASSSGIGPGGYVGVTTDPDGDSISTYEWDWDYDRVNFQQDNTGSSQSHQYVSANIGRKLIALRVTDSQGLSSIFSRQIRVLGSPTAIISVISQTSSVEPLAVILSGASSISPSSAITKYEWDLSYDNVTFIIEQTGVQAQLNSPYNSQTVALRVTDQDGQTHIVSQTITGKTVAPAAPTGLTAVGVFRSIILLWINPSVPDLYRIEIYRSTTNDSSTATVVAKVLGSIYIDENLAIGTTYYYWLKAINTSEQASGFSQTQFAGVSGSPLKVGDPQGSIEVKDGIITAPKISVSQLSAITADVGVLTAGVIRNSGSTLIFDLTNSKLTVNVAGGLEIQTADGLKITGTGGLEVSAADGIEILNGASLKLNAGGDIYLTDDASNPSEIRWRKASDTTKYWGQRKETTSEGLIFEPVGLTSAYLQIGTTSNLVGTFNVKFGTQVLFHDSNADVILALYDGGSNTSGIEDIVCNRTGGMYLFQPLSGSPESVVTARPGTQITATISGTTKLFIKSSGTGNTGWVVVGTQS